MTATCAPSNVSLLNPNEFRLLITRAPYLQFFTQTVSLPTIDMGDATPTSTPFANIATPGDNINFEDLSVVFLVDENLSGYIEMYHWIRGLGFPTSFDDYYQLVHEQNYNSRWEATTSDISVFTFSGSRNANIEWKFYDAFPVMVSAPTVSSANSDQPVVTAKVRFKYTYFDVSPVNIG